MVDLVAVASVGLPVAEGLEGSELVVALVEGLAWAALMAQVVPHFQCARPCPNAHPEASKR